MNWLFPKRWLLPIALLCLGCSGTAFRIYEENDVGGFGGGTDRYYSQGARMELMTSLSGQIPGLTSAARFFRLQPGDEDYALQKQYLGFSVGQNIYTPEDISIETLQVDDRPYAGWLFGTISWHNLALSHLPKFEREREFEDPDETRFLWTRNDRLDSLEIQVGMVGPSSYADETQTWVHKAIGSDQPKGWAHQIKDELGYELLYSRKLRNNYPKFSIVPLEHDLITNFGGALGNVDTHFQVGGQVRIGHNLRRDFGLGQTVPDLSLKELEELVSVPAEDLEAFRAQFGGQFSWYGFIGVDGRFVMRNIFLDGNTRKESHSVEKERFVADFRIGVAFQFRHFEIIYSQVARTPEFRRASDPQIFGSLQVGFKF